MTDETNLSTIKVKKDKVVGTDIFTDSSDYEVIGRTISPIWIVSQDSNGDPVVIDPFDSSGNLLSRQTDDKIDTSSNFPAPATDAVVTVATGQIWELVHVQGALQADGNVANRVFSIRVVGAIGMPAAMTAAVATIQTASITLTQNEEGQITLPSGPSHWTNDDGVIARVADENPIPLFIDAGSTITATSTNKQVADQLGLLVYFKIVNQV